MHADLEVALAAARAGAAVVRDGFDGDSAVTMKGDVDPVTAVDTAAEQAVFDVIAARRPDDQLLGEESGGVGWDGERVWIVDPLDGTVNFVHRVPHVAVSVALWSDSKPLVGVVVDPLRGEEFLAVAGEGTWLGDRRLSVTDQDRLEAALVVTGFPYDRRARAGDYAAVVGGVLAEVQGLRRLGSAALDFAWVACGRFDAYWEYGLGPWDAAAGSLLVSEAGGTITDHAGGRYDLGSSTIVASNGRIHDRLSRIVSDLLPVHLR